MLVIPSEIYSSIYVCFQRWAEMVGLVGWKTNAKLWSGGRISCPILNGLRIGGHQMIHFAYFSSSYYKKKKKKNLSPTHSLNTSMQECNRKNYPMLPGQHRSIYMQHFRPIEACKKKKEKEGNMTCQIGSMHVQYIFLRHSLGKYCRNPLGTSTQYTL